MELEKKERRWGLVSGRKTAAPVLNVSWYAKMTRTVKVLLMTTNTCLPVLKRGKLPLSALVVRGNTVQDIPEIPHSVENIDYPCPKDARKSDRRYWMS